MNRWCLVKRVVFIKGDYEVVLFIGSLSISYSLAIFEMCGLCMEVIVVRR